MRPKSIVLLILALGCGLIAAIGINEALKQPVQAVTVADTVPIFIAAEDISYGGVLTPQKVSLVNWPKDTLPAGTFANLEDFEGKQVSTKIFKGEPLIEGKIDKNKTVLDDLLPGMRLATVKVDAETGGAGLLKPGDHVDVIVSIKDNPSAGIFKSETIAPKDLRNLKILAIDNIHSRDGNGEQSVVGKTISLMATPLQVNEIECATKLGQIKLVGRNARDATNEDEILAVDFQVLKNGFGSTPKTGEKPNIGSILEKMLPTPPLEPVPPVVATVPEMKHDTMIIRLGATPPRQVLFDERGVPLDLATGGSPTSGAVAPVKDPDDPNATTP